MVPDGAELAIAEMLRGYDLVGLQEVDAGSRRSGYINLTEYLANRADFPFWDDRTNRRHSGWHHSVSR